MEGVAEGIGEMSGLKGDVQSFVKDVLYRIISKKSVPSVMNEKSLLASLQNSFIVNLVQAFQDRLNLYLLLDFLPGGDLRHHLSRKRFN